MGSWPEDGVGSGKVIQSHNSHRFKVYPICLTLWQVYITAVTSSVFKGLGCGHSPNPRKEAAEEEGAITLDEG